MRKIGRYALHDAIGSGGMATVHLGRLFGPRGFARIVAIKRLHSAYADDRDFTARFMQEAQLASRIRHPNVVPVLDVVADGGELSLVMEYVEGESLARLLRKSAEPVPIGIAAAIISGVLHGLHAAHEATGEDGAPLGVVHRDVSPQNVILGADGIARLLDFGVAKAVGLAPATRSGAALGKLAYMAPEQVRRERVTAAADVYAASVVLWEMICGRRLFRGEDEADVAEQVLIGLVPPPSRFVPAIEDALDAIVLRGLSGDPHARPDALAMALALEPFAALRGSVAAWVRGIAGEALAERAALVRSVEQTAPLADAPPRSRRGLWIGAAAALGIAAAYLSTREHPAPPPAPVAAAVSEPPPIVTPPPPSPIVTQVPIQMTPPPRARTPVARDAAPPLPSARRCESIDPVTGDIHFDRECR